MTRNHLRYLCRGEEGSKRPLLQRERKVWCRGFVLGGKGFETSYMQLKRTVRTDVFQKESLIGRKHVDIICWRVREMRR